MTYNAISQKLESTPDELARAARFLRQAMRNVRKAAGLPLDRYEQRGILKDAESAVQNILDAAGKLGIHYGTDWANELDLRET